jgi:Cft2 family RNA processing exonuclease
MWGSKMKSTSLTLFLDGLQDFISINEDDLSALLVDAIQNQEDLLFLKLGILYYEQNKLYMAIFCLQNGQNSILHDGYQVYKQWMLQSIAQKLGVLFETVIASPNLVGMYYFQKFKVEQTTQIIKKPESMDYYLYDYRDDDLEIIYYRNKQDAMVSMTLIKAQGEALLIDCGSYVNEDGRECQIEDLEAFLTSNGVNKEMVVGFVLTHAHLDHYGSINRLLHYFDYRMKLYTTPLTIRLLEISNGSIHLNRFYPFPYGKTLRIGHFKGIFHPAGHIPGALSLELESNNRRLFFTGDYSLHKTYGNEVVDFNKINTIDTLVLETTYGNKKEQLIPLDEKKKILKQILMGSMGERKTLFFPALAVGRTQDILVLLDSFNIKCRVLVCGFAVQVTDFYRKELELNFEFIDLDYQAQFNKELISNYDVIIASSGMLEVGSTSHQMARNMMRDDRFIVVQTGYIPQTNRLLKELKRNNGFVEISLSAHAQYEDLIETINQLKPKVVVQIHGEGIK